MPCDKVMEQPLEERLSFPRNSVDINNLAYEIRVNPETNNVQYRFPNKPNWINAD